MNHDEFTQPDGVHSESNNPTSRRRFLKGAAATGVAAVGVGAGTLGTTAQTTSVDVITISEGGWWSSEWSADGSFPIVDELLVFIHGWFGDTGVSSQTEAVLASVENAGYSPDAAVGIEWPATNLDFVEAESDTETVGEITAGLAEDFYDGGGGNIRLTGHSLGGRCVYWTATKLSSGYELETVAGMGAAADGSEICGDPWNPGLGNVCFVRNYHSYNDSTVGDNYGGSGDTALGTEGAGCDPASNYEDVDVTADVANHGEYLGSAAVGSDLASAIQSNSCDDGSTDGGNDDGSTDDGDSGWW